VGKTTVAERAAGLAKRQGIECGGLLAPAMMNSCGQKVGIRGVDIQSGKRRVLARTDQDLGGPAIGPYSFDAVALAWGLDVVEQAIGDCALLVVDEIGKLELWQNTGLAPVIPRLAAGEAQQALVIVRKGLLPELQLWLGPVDPVVFKVTEENRRVMPAEIQSWLI
jgi:nucleoside-triphosphatase THEP1